MASEIPVLLDSLRAKNITTYSLDVRSWDLSIPKEVQTQYLTLLYDGNERLTRVITDPLYNHCGLLFKLLKSPWPSGVNETLTGNSDMHDALLETFGLDGIVQGDDAVIFAHDSLTKEYIEKSYASAGLKLKACEKMFEFCGLRVVGDVFVVDEMKLLDKIAAGSSVLNKSAFQSVAVLVNRISSSP